MSVLRRMLASASRGESSLRRQQRAAPVIAVHREKCGKVIAGSSRKRQNRLTCLSRVVSAGTASPSVYDPPVSAIR